MQKLLTLFAALMLLNLTATAQKPFKEVNRIQGGTKKTVPLNVPAHSAPLPRAANYFDTPLSHFTPMQQLPAINTMTATLGNGLKVLKYLPQGRPSWVEGRLPAIPENIDLEDQAYLYLDALREKMGIANPIDEFVIKSAHQDAQGKTHLRMEQVYQGLPVTGGEIIVHAQDGQITGFNGQYQKTPDIAINPVVTEAQALDAVHADLAEKTSVNKVKVSGLAAKVLKGMEDKTTLVIHYAYDGVEPHLAWQVKTYPNVTEQWMYYIDARTGEVLEAYRNSCKLAYLPHVHQGKSVTLSTPSTGESKAAFADPLDGAVDASGVDLNGFMRGFKSYFITAQGKYYMIDITRPMYNPSASNLPDEPAGAIFTINANNTDPQASNFQVDHLISNSTSWTNQTAVSAHYNAGEAYEYYKNTFSRNSINGVGGTIYSIINVSDGGQNMDNAFWNGNAMFYGNGATAFKPLAGGLDVAGHEMTHGVVGATADLVYQGESGAINESTADIFGAMIDRDDWRIGEDVVKTNVFPSGALRDLSNPHNGGNSLGDPGWQPAHVNEQYNGNQDNGGVHINSGIPNKAFYLFATQVGKDKAEQVYYKALTDYLTKHSQFKDLRIAIIKAAEDLYGAGSNEASKVGPAFDAVGITGPNSGGGGNPGNNYQNDLQPNPGQDFIVFNNFNNSEKLGLATGAGNVDSGFESNYQSISNPTVSDDGTQVLYITPDNNIQGISINWSNGQYNENNIDNAGDNSVVAIAPDGSKMAVTSTYAENKIYVYDFGLQTWHSFDLYNPGTNNTKTYNVDYPDAVQFDYSGQYLVYDQRSSVTNQNGSEIHFWDIGFIHVWDGAAGNWADGSIEKLYSSLPEGASIGNPAFAKNSPYILAFDYIDPNGDYSLVGANIETGESAVIATNSTLSRPSYAPSDQYICATTDNNGAPILASVPVDGSKYHLDPNGQISTLVNNGKYGFWFANGSRPLVIGTSEPENDHLIHIAPNPFGKSFRIEANDGLLLRTITVYDAHGRLVKQVSADNASAGLNLSSQPAGLYFIKVLDQYGHTHLIKAMKQ